MALQATTIRIDSELKKQFESLCDEFGMSVNTAFNVFAKAVVRSRSIPFKIEEPAKSQAEIGREAFRKLREQAASLPEMTLEEINEEIAAYRAGK